MQFGDAKTALSLLTTMKRDTIRDVLGRWKRTAEEAALLEIEGDIQS